MAQDPISDEEEAQVKSMINLLAVDGDIEKLGAFVNYALAWYRSKGKQATRSSSC